MHKSSNEKQLFKSTTTGSVIRLPRRGKGTVFFLFSERTHEQMLIDGWEAIESSEYVGQTDGSMDGKIKETQELGLLG